MSHDAPVIVVGAGPVGLSFSLQMARKGVPTIILERKEEVSNHPRAHGLNTRTLELFRLWDCDDLIKQEQLPMEAMPHGLLAMMGGPSWEERESISPCIYSSVAQDIVEHSIIKKLNTYNLADLHWGWTVTNVTDKGDHVEVEAESSMGARKTFTGRYCVACDGANSSIRKSLGIEMIGDPCLDRVINVYFHGQIISDNDTVTLGQPSSDKSLPAVFIAMDGKKRHTFQYLLSEGEDAATFINDPALCESLIRRAAKIPPERDVVVKSIKPWTMTALVAERLRDGNIFLVGDAAHAFPPSGGFGLNSGVQDAHNLVWKMKAVLDGVATPDLLDTYEQERQPIAFLNTAQSFRNSLTMNIRGVPKPFNVSDEVIADINERAKPAGVRSNAAELQDEDERGAMEMIEHGAAMGQDLGFSYLKSSAIVYDGRQRPDMLVGKYFPNASPGIRAPHFWMKTPKGRISSLDLFDGDFTLLVGADGSTWRAAAGALGGVSPISVFAVGEGLDGAPEGIDFLELYGISASGAVLVRPDGHVAFRSENAVVDPSGALRNALDACLGRTAVPA